LYSERVRCFFPKVLTLGFPLRTLSLSGPLRTFTFRSIIRFRVVDNLRRDPTISGPLLCPSSTPHNQTFTEFLPFHYGLRCF
jgi:hypothetical protein